MKIRLARARSWHRWIPRVAELNPAELGLLIALAGLVRGLVWSGTEPASLRVLAAKLPADQQNVATNPSEPGPYQIETFTYGPGTDLRRPEYGAAVTWKARAVDGSRLLKNPLGWEGA